MELTPALRKTLDALSKAAKPAGAAPATSQTADSAPQRALLAQPSASAKGPAAEVVDWSSIVAEQNARRERQPGAALPASAPGASS